MRTPSSFSQDTLSCTKGCPFLKRFFTVELEYSKYLQLGVIFKKCNLFSWLKRLHVPNDTVSIAINLYNIVEVELEDSLKQSITIESISL